MLGYVAKSRLSLIDLLTILLFSDFAADRYYIGMLITLLIGAGISVLALRAVVEEDA